jgi:enamine deaminase RidA (YjgF/YER057c/UK114 family)
MGDSWARGKRQKYFEQGRFPARSAIGTSGLYSGARVEISCTAVVK